MKKFFLLLLIAVATVWLYYWYVRGINLLVGQDEGSTLPPYTSFAVRIPPKGAAPPPANVNEPVRQPTWTSAAPMPTPRTEVGGAAIDGTIYVVGGFDGFARTVATVEAFDVAKNAWSTVRQLPKPVHHPTVVAFGGKLYVFGGLTGLAMTPVDTVYIYDPERDAWSRGKDMPEAAGAQAAAIYEGRIHLFGGKGLGASVDTQYIYDPEKNEWATGVEMISGREHFGAAAVGKKIYVVGGRAASLLYNLDNLEVLDVESGQWDALTPMPTKRSGIVVLEHEGMIYVFGGESTATTFDDVQAYDPKTDRWQSFTPMPTARHGLGGAIVDGKFFLIAGGKRPGLSVTDVNEVFTP